MWNRLLLWIALMHKEPSWVVKPLDWNDLKLSLQGNVSPCSKIINMSSTKSSYFLIVQLQFLLLWQVSDLDHFLAESMTKLIIGNVTCASDTEAVRGLLTSWNLSDLPSSIKPWKKDPAVLSFNGLRLPVKSQQEGTSLFTLSTRKYLRGGNHIHLVFTSHWAHNCRR